MDVSQTTIGFPTAAAGDGRRRPVRLLMAFMLAALPLGQPAAAAGHDCLRFTFVGICEWLLCTPYGCTTKTSLKWGHYNPDLLVTVTNGSADHGAIAPGSPAAQHQVTGHGQRKYGLAYKDATAFGSPITSLYCPSAASSLKPYFLSDLDEIGWRHSLPELIYPQSLVPGLREIGSWPLNTWGAVYPRAGWITQTEDPKAAAVIAQRVGDIVTRGEQPHAYLELDSGGTFVKDSKLVWRPRESLTEGRTSTGDWQMIQPENSSACEAFGENDTHSRAGWSGGKLSDDGDYIWMLWRPYSCCDVKGQVFITSIDIVPFPVDE